MHPNPIFHWDDAAAMRALVAEVGLASIVAMTAAGPRSALAPLVWTGDDIVQYHLARSNRLAGLADGTPVCATIVGPHGYISPDWYGLDDQVPTWNYVAVELTGTVHRLDDAELASQLDQLSAAFEDGLAPKPVWTMDKMTPGRAEAMMRAITGFALRIENMTGVRKLGQHKPADARRAVADATAMAGNPALAALMREGLE